MKDYLFASPAKRRDSKAGKSRAQANLAQSLVVAVYHSRDTLKRRVRFAFDCLMRDYPGSFLALTEQWDDEMFVTLFRFAIPTGSTVDEVGRRISEEFPKLCGVKDCPPHIEYMWGMGEVYQSGGSGAEKRVKDDRFRLNRKKLETWMLRISQAERDGVMPKSAHDLLDDECHIARKVDTTLRVETDQRKMRREVNMSQARVEMLKKQQQIDEALSAGKEHLDALKRRQEKCLDWQSDREVQELIDRAQELVNALALEREAIHHRFKTDEGEYEVGSDGDFEKISIQCDPAIEPRRIEIVPPMQANQPASRLYCTDGEVYKTDKNGMPKQVK